jgi:hypothetical protein
MAAQTSENLDDSFGRSNSANRTSPRSEVDDHVRDDSNPGVPQGLDRNAQVQLTHKEASAKLKALVKEMTALLKAHGFPTDSCGFAAFSVSNFMRSRGRLHEFLEINMLSTAKVVNVVG